MKIEIGQVPYLYPIPIALVGAVVQGKVNFETIGDVGLVGINPALVMISSNKEHFTNIGILETNSFSINFPSTSMLTLTDYCGIVSGKAVDKSHLFDTFTGSTGAPMISDCPVNMECNVIKEFSILHRQVFIGEVCQTYVSEEFMEEKNGKPALTGLEKLDPILYALDNQYYSVGKKIGVGYQEGKKFSLT